VTVFAVACGGLGACGDEADLAARIEAEIEAATVAEASGFTFGDPRLGESAGIDLVPPEGQADVSAEDLVATLLIIDEYRGKARAMRRSNTFEVGGSTELLTGAWDEQRSSDGAAGLNVLTSVGGPYGDVYCRLAELQFLSGPDAGSDFSRIAECNPELRQLVVGAWDQSTGLDGLAELEHLEWLMIYGTVTDVAAFPRIESLKELTVHLAEDTVETRYELRRRLPLGCHVTYRDTPDNPASRPAEEGGRIVTPGPASRYWP
jgi:hypothetical protein